MSDTEVNFVYKWYSGHVKVVFRILMMLRIFKEHGSDILFGTLLVNLCIRIKKKKNLEWIFPNNSIKKYQSHKYCKFRYTLNAFK